VLYDNAVTARRQPSTGVAFLLAQLGVHAASRFAARVAEIGLDPATVGLLRMIARQPGRSQQSLAEELGVVRSRVVALMDNLEGKGLVERRRSATDRRNYELHLTPDGIHAMGQMRDIGAAHESDICAALTAEQHDQLKSLLEAIADQQGLAPGVHPGYRLTDRGGPERVPPQHGSTT
jgi:DNA-binding MarR family transcriptional regulator